MRGSESSSAPPIKPEMRRLYQLSGTLWPPGILRVAPVDPVEQAGKLRTRQRHHAVLRRGPDEAALLEPLGVKRHADPVVPDDLHQRADRKSTRLNSSH